MPSSYSRDWQVGALEDAADRRHDETLRLECLRIATMLVVDVALKPSDIPAEVARDFVSKHARQLYHEATGQRWPEWGEPEPPT